MYVVCPACGATNRAPEGRANSELVCGRCRADLMPAGPAALTDATFPAPTATKRRCWWTSGPTGAAPAR